MQKDLKIKVGERITQLRTAKKLSQQKFSYEADMERTYISHIEKGRKNISLSTLEKVTGALEISIKDFFDSEIFTNGKKKKA
jgi:transcriptional regulator with XRE-family HTH domain